MAIQRKRKYAVAAADRSPSPHADLGAAQRSIKSFGGVSKPIEQNVDPKKRKMLQSRDQNLPSAPAAKPVQISDKKRKRRSDDESDEGENNEEESITVRREAPSTPRTKRAKNVVEASSAETPTKKALALFDKLQINSISSFAPVNPSQARTSYDTPSATPGAEDNFNLQHLHSLYSALIAALSMYYSHNGTTSPVNVGALLPTITKHWKKRTVNLDDLRLILALDQDRQELTFTLQDFGRAGICLVRDSPRGRPLQRTSSFIDAEHFSAQFETSLSKVWQNWKANLAKQDESFAAFLQQLPRIEITANESAEKAAPLFARGQQRLADLKAGQTAAASPKSNGLTTPAEPSPSPNFAQDRGTALLDRIRAKQTAATSLPQGPGKRQLERIAALQRVEDITRVLSLLAGSRDRCSFSFAAITQRLQQSLRNPIATEEIERCMAILATDVLPDFVQIVCSGAVRCVILTKRGNVGSPELKDRVERAKLSF